jgi:hypothetical protein
VASTPRARARLLLRSGRAQPGLFVPLVLVQAAEIEALTVDEFLTNPTKLAKGLTALHQSLGTDAITVAGPEVLGAADQLDAAVEATSRLATTAPGDPVLVAVLPGPATVAGGVPEGAAESEFEQASECILEALKRFVEAGTNLVVIIEEAAPTPESAAEAWQSAIRPLVNVTRFHQAVPVVVFSEPAAGAGVAGTTAAVTLPPEPKEWDPPARGAPLTVTAGVVPAHCSFAEVHEACRRFMAG